MLVTNTKDHPVLLLSHCGNSVQIGAKAKRQRVANRFAWQTPAGVILENVDEDETVDPTTHVRGRPVMPMANPPRTAEQARDHARKGIEPHQTPEARAAAVEMAKKILAENASKTDTSTITGAQAMNARLNADRVDRGRMEQLNADTKAQDRPASDSGDKE